MTSGNRPDRIRARGRRGPEAGATAVEFAMVAMPFLFMIFSILELALVFVVSTTLENAMGAASRQIRTGEFQQATSGFSAAELEEAFRENVCGKMSFMEDHCQTNLSVDVQPLTDFDSGGSEDPVQDDGTFDDGDLGVANTNEGQRVLARSFYRWPLVTPFLGEALARADGKAVIEAAVVFQNEPFGETL